MEENIEDKEKKRKRRPKRHTNKRIVGKQKAFAKNYIKFRGNKAIAYAATYPNSGAKTARVNGCMMVNKPEVKNEIERLLKKTGLTKDYFITKLKDLAEAKDKDGNSDNRIQFDVMKLGFEFYGLVNKKQETPTTAIQVNYNLDTDKLSGVLNKLSEVTKKLELNKGMAENAEIIDTKASQED